MIRWDSMCIVGVGNKVSLLFYEQRLKTYSYTKVKLATLYKQYMKGVQKQYKSCMSSVVK